MVVLWIFDILFETLVATSVTIHSMMLSYQTGIASYDTSMWASIGNSVSVPLVAGGAVWMVKNAIQHAISNRRGKEAHKDFPEIDEPYDGDINEGGSLE